jgi:hypothetical protein
MGPRRRTSSIRLEGVAASLNQIHEQVVDDFRAILVDRHGTFHNLPEEEIETHARLAGTIARAAAADGVAAAFQIGIKREVVTEWPTELVRKEVAEKLEKKLRERRAAGRNELEDQEIEAQARHAGMIAKEASAAAIGESHLMGVDHESQPADHTRATTPAPVPPKKQ